MLTHSHICRILAVAIVAWAVAVAETETRASEADDQYAVAAGHYDRKNWRLAIEEFRTFVERYPGDPRTTRGNFYLGEALRQLGRFDEAREQFQKYVRAKPKGEHAAAAMFGSGEAAYSVGNLDAARSDLTEFLAKYPGDPLGAYALPYLGDIALRKDDNAAAATFFRDALKRFPKGSLQDDCRLGLARVFEKQNQMEEAERLYTAVAAKPSSPLADTAQFQLGALQYAAARYEQAIESFSVFEKRLKDSPWRSNARLGHGLALLKLDRPAEAVERFDAALALPATDADVSQQAMRGRIQAALKMKDYAAVDRDAAKFEKQFPKSELTNDVRRMLARSLVERKEYKKAVLLLEPMIGEKPADQLGQQDLENRYLLAVSDEGLGRYQDALATLAPVVERAEGQLKRDALATQGSLLLALKKYPEAVAPLEAFLNKKTSSDAEARALGELAICLARSAQIDKAKKRYAELIEKHPGHAMVAPITERLAEAAYDANDAAWSAELSNRLTKDGGSTEYELKGRLSLGWSQYKAGKLAEAAATFDELLKKNPPEPIAAEAAFLRGRILEELGRSESALAMFNRVIDKYPKSKQHGDALLSAARLHEKLKHHAEAAAMFERLAAVDPQYPKLDAVLYEWAWAMRDLGKPAEAGRLFERLRKEYPTSRYRADATYRLAQRAFDAKNFDAAARLTDEVLGKTTPTVPRMETTEINEKVEPSGSRLREYALFLRGQAAVAQADWAKARIMFETLIREKPDAQRRVAAEFWIAESHYREGDYAAASAHLDRIAEQIGPQREPWMAMIPLRRAQVLAQQGRWTDAYAIAAKIEKDYPNFEQQYEVDYLLGRCLANQADFESARQAYAKAIHSATGEKTETAAMAQWMTGETYFHQKNYEAALREYHRLVYLYAYPNWQSAALLQAGKCSEQLGQAKEAAELYRRIMAVYPRTPYVQEAKQRLAKLEKTK